MEIIFSKKDHRYISGDQVFTSVSKVLSKYKNEFNHDHWSTYKALETLIPDFKTFKKGWNIDTSDFIEFASQHVDSEKLSLEKSKILNSWEDANLKSINKGNQYHERREAMSYEQGFEVNPFTGGKFQITESPSGEKTNLISNLYNLQDGFYPELLIWNSDTLIAGQADKVFIETVGDNRYVDIDDYKTNKQIKKSSYKNQKMKPPLSHLMDCNYTHYNLQISFYAWMLEEFGFHVRNLSFHHFNQMYKLKYLRSEVKAIAKNG